MFFSYNGYKKAFDSLDYNFINSVLEKYGLVKIAYHG